MINCKGLEYAWLRDCSLTLMMSLMKHQHLQELKGYGCFNRISKSQESLTFDDCASLFLKTSHNIAVSYITL